MLILSACSAENELASAGNGNEILFTVEEEPIKPDSAVDGATTRATKVTSISSFKLYAYNSSGTAIADGITYTKSGSSWTTTSKVFWPQTGNVTFYAFSPASNSSVSFNTTSKTLTYTAPTSQDSQQDVLYAYASSSRPTSNTVNLTFNHANAAFSVSAQLATGCTATVNVSGVKLVNVMPTNTLTVSSGAASASGSSISTDVAINSTTLTTTAATISSSPLMLPPQSVTAWSGTSALANTYLAVTCKVQANDKYVVGSASANGTVYVPMDKTLTKGQENTVNLIFGSEGTNGRSYGRDENGNKITVLDGATTKDEITSADVGRVICTDGSVYSTVSEAEAAGKTAAGMIAYVSEQGHGIALALHDEEYTMDDYGHYTNYTFSTNEVVLDDALSEEGWHTPSIGEWSNMFDANDGYIIDDGNYGYDSGNLNENLIKCGGEQIGGDVATSDSWEIGDSDIRTVYYDFENKCFSTAGGNCERNCFVF